MFKVILDPGLFEIEVDEDEYTHYVYLKNSVNFLLQNCDVSIDAYEGAPYYYIGSPTYQNPPITNNKTIRDHYSTLKSTILKLMVKGKKYGTFPPASCNIERFTHSNSISCKSFFSYIDSIFHGQILNFTSTKLNDRLPRCMLLLSKKNQALDAYNCIVNNDEIIIYALADLGNNCSGVVFLFLLSQMSESPFPSCSACSELNSAYLQEIETTKGNISVMDKYGREFASRNFYIHDHTVSRKNPQYLVFVNPSKQFAISIDREHGGIELFEWSSGKWSHLGEFNYSGERTQEAGTKRNKHILNS